MVHQMTDVETPDVFLQPGLDRRTVSEAPAMAPHRNHLDRVQRSGIREAELIIGRKNRDIMALAGQDLGQLIATVGHAAKMRGKKRHAVQNAAGNVTFRH